MVLSHIDFFKMRDMVLYIVYEGMSTVCIDI